MRRVNKWLLAFIVLLTVAAIYVVWPQKPEKYLGSFIPWPASQGVHIDFAGLKFDRQGFVLGLDLQGGSRVLMEGNLANIPPQDRDNAQQATRSTIERRVNAFGISEAQVGLVSGGSPDTFRIQVQLPGVKDLDQAISLIGKTAQLEFKKRGPGTCTNIPTNQPCPTDQPFGLTGKQLSRASAGLNPQTQEPVVNFEFNQEGTQLFSRATTELAGNGGQIAIYLDNEVISAPSLRNGPITGGKGFIEGNFTLQQAQELATQLNSGALPVPLTVQQVSTVDATLGADSIQRSVLAGEIGLGIVLLFMIIYYRAPGVMAGLALIVYSLTTLMLFKLIPVTMTLAGIAGFILSVGMAVDANILIFERMKEEVRAGRTLGGALEAGFQRAWTSIRDSNASTLITCLILFVFGNVFGASLVTGFAITLALGVAVSMFTAITVTRTFMRLLISTPLADNLWLFGMEEPEIPEDTDRPTSGPAAKTEPVGTGV